MWLIDKMKYDAKKTCECKGRIKCEVGRKQFYVKMMEAKKKKQMLRNKEKVY